VLVELTVAEQRFNAVMEVLRDGLTVIEVAGRYSVSRQTVMAGCAATGPAGWTPWPTARIGPASAPTRCRPRSRLSCSATTVGVWFVAVREGLLVPHQKRSLYWRPTRRADRLPARPLRLAP
jgi:hypothetical protein